MFFQCRYAGLRSGYLEKVSIIQPLLSFFKIQKPRTTRSYDWDLRVHSSDFYNLDILQLKHFFFFCYHSFYFFVLSYLALSPTFTVSAGELAEASPYNCYLECLKQNIIQKDKPLTIGLAQGTICLCGHDPSKYFLFCAST